MATVVTVSRARKETATGLKRLPKLTSPLLRLNGLCPYYTMFPLSFPFAAADAKGQSDCPDGGSSKQQEEGHHRHDRSEREQDEGGNRRLPGQPTQLPSSGSA